MAFFLPPPPPHAGAYAPPSTAQRRRSSSEPPISTTSKLWRVASSDTTQNDAPIASAIQRGSGSQVSLDKLLRSPPSNDAAVVGSAAVAIAKRSTVRAGRGTGARTTYSTPAERQPTSPRCHVHQPQQVSFLAHVRIASSPPRSELVSAKSPATERAAVNAAESPSQLKGNSPSSSRLSTPITKRSRWQLRPSIAPSSSDAATSSHIGESPVSPASPNAYMSLLARARLPPRPGSSSSLSSVVRRKKHRSTSPAPKRSINHCEPMPGQVGFPEGYIVARLHPDGSSTSRPQSARSRGAIPSFDGLFRPAKPQDLAKPKSSFYPGTLILVRGEEEGRRMAARQEKEDFAHELQRSDTFSKARSKRSAALTAKLKESIENFFYVDIEPAERSGREAQQVREQKQRRRANSTTGSSSHAQHHASPAFEGLPAHAEQGERAEHNESAVRMEAHSTPPTSPTIPSRKVSARPATAPSWQTAPLSSADATSQIRTGEPTSATQLRQAFSERHEPVAVRESATGDTTEPIILENQPIILWSGYTSHSTSSASSGSSRRSTSSSSSSPSSPAATSGRDTLKDSRELISAKMQEEEAKSPRVVSRSQHLKEVASRDGLAGLVRLAVKNVARGARRGMRPRTPAPSLGPDTVQSGALSVANQIHEQGRHDDLLNGGIARDQEDRRETPPPLPPKPKLRLDTQLQGQRQGDEEIEGRSAIDEGRGSRRDHKRSKQNNNQRLTPRPKREVRIVVQPERLGRPSTALAHLSSHGGEAQAGKAGAQLQSQSKEVLIQEEARHRADRCTAASDELTAAVELALSSTGHDEAEGNPVSRGTKSSPTVLALNGKLPVKPRRTPWDWPGDAGC
ncbi:hypothetical protein BDZ90DRAFT_261656 [Jaminaea rosea]|uniref:Uncharacterized protein n=1 Tax=Jaminaea rosea TaxID=1569628 RepID=A0A316UM38_9BASI|nr:hypothetical protein BDZ90DRAFT_261656 [Jaminaea rosea]PWN26346.1 hypothetical protein BDZ90DRAFT_261656 [Jaminaea rosea]